MSDFVMLAIAAVFAVSSWLLIAMSDSLMGAKS